MPYLPPNQQCQSTEGKKLKSKKTGMLRSTGKQSGESVETVLEKKRKVTVGRICRKERF